MISWKASEMKLSKENLKRILSWFACSIILLVATVIGAGISLAYADDGNASNEYSYRLLVGFGDKAQPVEGDAILGEHNGIALLGYDDAATLEKAKQYYEGRAEFATIDGKLSATSDEGKSIVSAESTESVKQGEDPISILGGLGKAGKSYNEDGLVIALIDSGVPEAPNVIARESVIGDEIGDDNGHGEYMLQQILEENPNARIYSIKAIDAGGHGSVASVCAAIERAIEVKADIINLSISGYETDNNKAIATVIQEALDAGLTVVAAAGNGGHDADNYIPGNIPGVFTVGAADEMGLVSENSNRGDCVDAYIKNAVNTSVAAARVSGWISAGNDTKSISEWEQAAIPVENVSGDKGAEDGEGITTQSTLTLTYNDSCKHVMTYTISNYKCSVTKAVMTSTRTGGLEQTHTWTYRCKWNGSRSTTVTPSSGYVEFTDQAGTTSATHNMSLVREITGGGAAETKSFALSVEGDTHSANTGTLAVPASTSTVTLNKQSGSGGTNSVTATYGSAMPSATMPTRTGYTFAGYYDATSGGTQYYTAAGASARSWNKTGSTATLYARWTANTYTVTLNKQSGTGGSGSVTATYGSAMPSATMPTRTGYTFGGYYDATSGGTQYYTATGASARSWNKTANTTLYARWTANTYTVTLNKQSGTGGSSSVTATYGSAMPSATMPTRTGYTFAGYYDATSGGTQYYTAAGASARSWNKTANTTLYARWTANKAVIKYHVNGGAVGGDTYKKGSNNLVQTVSDGADVTVTKNYGSEVNLHNYGTFSLTRTGYHIDATTAWNTNSSGTGTSYDQDTNYDISVLAPNIGTTATTNITLYANWKPTVYKITLDQTNATTTGSNAVYEKYNTGIYREQACTTAVTTSAGVASVPKRTGYTFGGYYTASDGSGTQMLTADGKLTSSFTNTKYTAATTLYPKWTINKAVIKYHVNGGTVGGETYQKGSNNLVQTASNGADVTTAKNYGDTVNLYNYGTFSLTRTGYHIDAATAWNTNSSGTGTSYNQDTDYNISVLAPNIGTTATTNITLYANWKPTVYKITLAQTNATTTGSGEVYEKYNTGIYREQACTTAVTTSAGVASVPKRTGYTFGGYYTGSDGSGTQRITADGKLTSNFTSTTYTAAATLYPKWTANTYTVVYNGNGATSGSVANSTHTYGTSKALNQNAYQNTGLYFVGWNTKANGSGTSYSDQQPVLNLTATNGGTVTLYAQWGLSTYTIHYNGNGSTSGSTVNSVHTYDVARTLTPNGFVRTGWVFSNWNTQANGSGTSYSDKQSVINLTSQHGAVIELYAQWRRATMQVTYNANGGSIATGTGTTRYRVSSSGILQRSTDSGSTWSNYITTLDTSSAGANLIDVSSAGLTKTGYHVVTTEEWNLSANGNGTAFNQAYSSTSTANPPTTKRLNGGTEISADSSVTIFADWVPNTYTIHYNANGGTGAPSDQTNVVYDASVTFSSVVPTRAGYSFVGWARTANATEAEFLSNHSYAAPNIATSGTGQVYAVWSPYHLTVKYNANGAEFDSASGSPVEVVNQELATEVYSYGGTDFASNGVPNANGTPWKLGKTGAQATARWRVGSASSTTFINADTSYATVQAAATAMGVNLATGNRTVNLYADWEALHYTIHYDANGGSGAPANQDAVYGSDTVLSNSTPQRSGHRFLGWDRDHSAVTPEFTAGGTVNSLVPSGTVVLYAIWTPYQMTVSYYGNGGTIPASSSPDIRYRLTAAQSKVQQSLDGGMTWTDTTTRLDSEATHDEAIKKIEELGLTRTGYHIDNIQAWNTSPEGNGVSVNQDYDPDSSPANAPTAERINLGPLTADVAAELYANWIPNTYTIVYNANGGSNEPASQQATYDADIELTGDMPSWDADHQFLGWADSDSATSPQYAPGQSVRNLATGGEVVLYAVWGSGYSVVFDGNGATSGEMASQMFGRNVSAALNLNQYGRTFNLAFQDSPHAVGYAGDSRTSTSTFGGWSLSNVGPVAYEDGQVVTNIDRGAGSVTLYAVWRGGEVDMPEATLGDWTLSYWIAPNGRAIIAGDVYTPDTDGTYTAVWTSQNPEAGTVYAVLTDAEDSTGGGHLVFIRSRQDIENDSVDEIYDLNGLSYHGTIYRDIENLDLSDASAPWHDNATSIVQSYVAPNTKITPQSLAYWYADCSNLQVFSLDGFDVSGVENFQAMFSGASAIQSLTFAYGDFSSAENMSEMFKNCSNLAKVDFTGATLPSLTNLSQMFSGDVKLTEVVFGDAFDTSHVTTMSGMFAGCEKMRELVLPFDTSALTDTSQMFSGATHLRNLDISSFDTSSIVNATDMFANCPRLYQIELGEHFAEGDSEIILPSGHDSRYYTENWTNFIDSIKYDEFDTEYDGEDMAGSWVWEDIGGLPEYPIIYDLEDGMFETPAPETYRVVDGVLIPNPVKAGYEFAGWTGTNGKTPQVSVEILPGAKGTHIYNAHWTQVETVTNMKDNLVSAKFRKISGANNQPLPDATIQVFKADSSKIQSLADVAENGEFSFATALENANWNNNGSKGTYNREILSSNGYDIHDMVVTDATGDAQIPGYTLDQGIYVALETAAPAGYSLIGASFYAFEVSESTPGLTVISQGLSDGEGTPVDMVFSNLPEPRVRSIQGGLALTKHDNEGHPLEGAGFSVYDREIFEEAIRELDTENTGVTPELLYTLVVEQDTYAPIVQFSTNANGIGTTTEYALPVDNDYVVIESEIPCGYVRPAEAPLYYIYSLTADMAGTIISSSTTDGGTPLSDTVVVNEKLSYPTSVTVHKVVGAPGYELSDDEFIFDLFDAADTDFASPIATARNTADGDVTFVLGDVTADDIGTERHYTIKERISGDDWDWDTQVKEVTVSIRGDGEDVLASATISGENGNTFINRLIPDNIPTGLILPGTAGAAVVLLFFLYAFNRRKKAKQLAGIIAKLNDISETSEN